ncbi:hypothetical protein [uncultured Aquimarina sp.]|uniref:hypothetical protein n=1 Tax=uncultured Aquimarina sp. TaxID=575652 RepID=UPI00261AA52A|nr:hypothetical protein [uncultured Aquimarina sp.]
MNQSIINRIQELGGNVDNIKGESLEDDILSITFDTVLYQKPTDTPWSKAEDEEPIYGIGEFVDENMDLFKADSNAFYNKIIEKYFRDTDEGFGQTFWVGKLFTPFKEGSLDFQEWNDDFMDDEMTNLEEITKVTNDSKPDFIHLFYDYGYPDNIYISLSDPNPENPTLFGTDHEVFFNEISNEGTFENYLKTFMTKNELLEIVKNKLEK